MAVIDITGRIEQRRRQAESFSDIARINVPVRTAMRRQFNVRLVEG